MHRLQNMKKLSSVKDSLLRVEQPNQSNCIKELNTIDKLSQKVYVVLVFVGSYKLHDKWRGYECKCLLLIEDMLLKFRFHCLLL